MRNLLILARWLAAKANIDVVMYNGSTACIGQVGPSNRNVIQIPRKWNYSNDPQAADLLEGVIDHEALGHGRHSDLGLKVKVEKDGLIKWSKLSLSIQNILEDVYIENQAIKTYPGVKGNLARTTQILLDRGFFGTPEQFAAASPKTLLEGGLLNVLRGTLIPGQEQVFAENVVALNELLLKVLGGVWIDVLEIANEVKTSTGTMFNIQLTVKIMTLLDEFAKKQTQDEKPKPDSEPQQEPDEAPADADDSEEPDEAPVDADDSQEPDEAPADADDSQEPTEEADIQGDDVGNENVVIDPDELDRVIEVAREIVAASDEESIETELSDLIAKVMGEIASSEGNLELPDSLPQREFTDRAKEIASKVKRISDDLQEALETQTKCKKRTKLTGRRVNNRVLFRTRLGDGRIFKTVTEAVGVSTAVSILFDISGSMRDELLDKVARDDAAMGLVLGMGDILDEFGVPFEVNAYSDRFVALKEFGQEWSDVRRGGKGPSTFGGTHTGQAMQRVVEGMVCRPESRRLVIVLTDGDTCDLPTLFSVYAEAKELEVEIASVMIGPNIPSIEKLSQEFGFPAKHCDKSDGLGKFAVERILEAI